jgi:hypothetical protein
VERANPLPTAAIRFAWRAVVGLAAFVPATGTAYAENAAASESRSFLSAFESIQSSDLKKHAANLADDTFEGCRLRGGGQ